LEAAIRRQLGDGFARVGRAFLGDALLRSEIQWIDL
jgi:hypothetical protein